MGTVILSFQQVPRGAGAMSTRCTWRSRSPGAGDPRHATEAGLGVRCLGGLSPRSHCALGLPAPRSLSTCWLPWGGW